MFIFDHIDFEIPFKQSNTDIKESFNGLFRSSGKRVELETYCDCCGHGSNHFYSKNMYRVPIMKLWIYDTLALE